MFLTLFFPFKIGAQYESLLSIRGMMHSRRLPANYHPVNKPEFWEFMGSKTDLGKVFLTRLGARRENCFWSALLGNTENF
jgi:hypothetical protein